MNNKTLFAAFAIAFAVLSPGSGESSAQTAARAVLPVPECAGVMAAAGASAAQASLGAAISPSLDFHQASPLSLSLERGRGWKIALGKTSKDKNSRMPEQRPADDGAGPDDAIDEWGGGSRRDRSGPDDVYDEWDNGRGGGDGVLFAAFGSRSYSFRKLASLAKSSKDEGSRMPERRPSDDGAGPDDAIDEWGGGSRRDRSGPDDVYDEWDNGRGGGDGVLFSSGKTIRIGGSK